MKKSKARAKLDNRIGRYEKALKNDPKYAMHKPGSQRGHKQ